MEFADLVDATPEQAEHYFESVDAEELVEHVSACTDEEILSIIGRPELRSHAIATILRRLDEFALPDRLAQMTGSVRFDLHRRGKLLEQHGLSFAGGTMTFHEGGIDDPDVVLSLSILRLVRIMTGQLNAGLAYLSGVLDIEGDTHVALELGGLFQVPGQDGVAVDPRMLDAVDVATALGQVKGGHLKTVMTSGFRPIVLGEIFRRLPDFVNEGRAQGQRLVVAFKLTGNPAGEDETYVVELADGRATIHEGPCPELDRDATITAAGHDFLRLATGHLSPVTGVLKGQLKVAGDKARALKFNGLIDFPQAR